MGRQGQRKAADISPVGAPPPCGSAERHHASVSALRRRRVKTAAGGAGRRGRRSCPPSCRAATAPGRPRAGTAGRAAAAAPPMNAPTVPNSSCRATSSRSSARRTRCGCRRRGGRRARRRACRRSSRATRARSRRTAPAISTTAAMADRPNAPENSCSSLLGVDLAGEDRDRDEQGAPDRDRRAPRSIRYAARRGSSGASVEAAGAEPLGRRVRRRSGRRGGDVRARDDARAGRPRRARAGARPVRPRAVADRAGAAGEHQPVLEHEPAPQLAPQDGAQRRPARRRRRRRAGRRARLPGVVPATRQEDGATRAAAARRQRRRARARRRQSRSGDDGGAGRTSAASMANASSRGSRPGAGRRDTDPMVEWPPVHRSVILGAARTPFGRLLGGLAPVSAVDLGAVAARGAIERSRRRRRRDRLLRLRHRDPGRAGPHPVAAGVAGGRPARGRRLRHRQQGLRLRPARDRARRRADRGSASTTTVLAGGMESMTNAPHLAQGARKGYRFGDATLVDSMIWDALRDPWSGKQMFEQADAVGDRARHRPRRSRRLVGALARARDRGDRQRPVRRGDRAGRDPRPARATPSSTPTRARAATRRSRRWRR